MVENVSSLFLVGAGSEGKEAGTAVLIGSFPKTDKRSKERIVHDPGYPYILYF
jgi:hypothetical protein